MVLENSKNQELKTRRLLSPSFLSSFLLRQEEYFFASLAASDLYLPLPMSLMRNRLLNAQHSQALQNKTKSLLSIRFLDDL